MVKDNLRLNVPFLIQKDALDCGNTVSQIAFNYFRIKNICGSLITENSGATWTISIANYLAQNNLSVKFYSKHIEYNKELESIEYYDLLISENSTSENTVKALFDKCRELEIELIRESVTLEYILEMMNQGHLPIVLVDWSKIINTESFIGHFVLLVGYDKDSLFLHNTDNINPEPYKIISKRIFENSRKAIGTDEDLIFATNTPPNILYK